MQDKLALNLHSKLILRSLKSKLILKSKLKKGSCKIKEMKLQSVWNGGNFFSANVSNNVCFLREVCGKQQSGERRLLGTYVI